MSLAAELARTEQLIKAIRTERRKLARIVELAGKAVPQAEMED